MKALETIKKMLAIRELAALGGEVYLVGGVVRDHFLQKESKDIDLIVRLLPMDKIVETLNQHGKLELVGESFAVLKFMPYGWMSEPIDIALPRTETKIGEGHKGFDVQSDYMLSIEEDLIRRDITINSMAVSLDGKLIDPFNGFNDIVYNKTIKATSTQSFSDDPLRMLRCVQFASRFGFTIEKETMCMIQQHAHLIKQISGERMKGELDKVQAKGKLDLAAKLLNDSGLANHMFGQSLFNVEALPTHFKTAAEFYAELLSQFVEPDKLFAQKFKGDTVTSKLIKALTLLKREIKDTTAENDIRITCAQAVRLSYDTLLDLDTTKDIIGDVALDFASGMPKRVTELRISGEDLMDKGLKGKEIGDTLNALLKSVLCKELENQYDVLLATL